LAGLAHQGPDEWATFRQLRPTQWQALVELEDTFDRTLRRKETILEVTERGVPFGAIGSAGLRRQVNARVILSPWWWIRNGGHCLQGRTGGGGAELRAGK